MVAISSGIVQSSSTGAVALTVAYDAGSNSYTLTDSNHNAAFVSADRVAGEPAGVVGYSQSNGNQLTLYTTTPSSHSPLSYVGLGVWSDTQNSGADRNTTTFDTFTYGTPTPASATPRTGAAAYSIDLVGYLTTPGVETRSLAGPGFFNADFLSGSFNAQVFPVETGLVSGSTTSGGGYQFIAGGALSSSNATFSGQASFSDNNSINYVGPIAGRLYGPVGQDVGASFTGGNPNGGTVVGSFFGTQYGAPPGENLALPNIIVSQQFPAYGGVFITIVTSSGGVSETEAFIPSTSQITLAHGGAVAFSVGNQGSQDISSQSAIIAPPSRPNFTTYQETVGGNPIQLDLYKVGSGNTELALSYLDLGIWRQVEPVFSNNQTQTETDSEYFLYGLQTPMAVLGGLTGSAQYTGVAYGGSATLGNGGPYNVTGTSSFNVNFSSQSFTGSMTLNGANVGIGPAVSYGAFNFGGAIGLAGNQVTITQNGADAGQMVVRFYGPTAEEVGGTFTLGNSTVGEYMQGVVAAKKH